MLARILDLPRTLGSSVRLRGSTAPTRSVLDPAAAFACEPEGRGGDDHRRPRRFVTKAPVDERHLVEVHAVEPGDERQRQHDRADHRQDLGVPHRGDAVIIKIWKS